MTKIPVDWTELKNFVDDRNLSIQWLDIGGAYHLLAFDGLFSLTTKLIQETPATSDQEDFQDNYKADGNKSVGLKLMGQDGATIVDIETEAGKNKMLMKGDIDVVNEYYGKDHFASAWAKITNSVDSTDITLNIGDHGPWSIPVNTTDDNEATQDAIDWLNAQTSPDFKTYFKATKVLDNPIIHIESKIWGEAGEEVTFSTSGSGGTTTSDGFSDFEMRKKLISLSFDKRDPRTGIVGMSGRTTTIAQSFSKNFIAKGLNGESANMRVNGGETPVEFIIENPSSELDLIIEEVRITGQDGGIIFSKFFDISPLENGLVFEICSEGIITTYPVMKTTQDMVLLFCRGGISFYTHLDKSGLFIFKPSGTILLQKNSNDYIKLTVQDDFMGLVALEYSANGYYEE